MVTCFGREHAQMQGWAIQMPIHLTNLYIEQSETITLYCQIRDYVNHISMLYFVCTLLKVDELHNMHPSSE